MLNKMHFAAGEIPEKAAPRIGGDFSLEPDERVILFYNLSLFRFGAAGVIFTSRRVIRYDTKSYVSTPNEEIQSVSFENLHKMSGTAYLTVGGQKTHLGIFDSKDFKEVDALLAPYVPVESEGFVSEEELLKRTHILEMLFSPEGRPAMALTFAVPMSIATGAGHFAQKVAWGMVTRGIGACLKNRYTMDTVRLPETCCLCGVLLGRKLKSSELQFRQGTDWSLIMSIDPDSIVRILYRVCEPCAIRPEEAVKIANFRKEGDKWLLTLSVRNPDVAARIGALNAVVPDVLQS